MFSPPIHNKPGPTINVKPDPAIVVDTSLPSTFYLFFIENYEIFILAKEDDRITVELYDAKTNGLLYRNF